MDGFHLANEVLDDLGRRERKGADDGMAWAACSRDHPWAGPGPGCLAGVRPQLAAG